MEVGNLRELLGHQSAIEGVQAFHARVFSLEVGFHETDIRSQIIKEGTCEPLAQHGDTDIWVLVGQCPYHRHNHCHITQCGESYNEYMLLLHLLIILFFTLIKDWVRSRIVVHLHLAIHLHILPASLNIF